MPTDETLRVMIDSNVIISAVMGTKGAPGKLIKEVIQRGDHLLICPFILDEVRKVLTNRFQKSPHLQLIWERLSFFLPFDVLPHPSGEEIKSLDIPLIRDENDLMILSTAIYHNVHVFVTGDKDYHTPEIKKKLNVMNPSEFYSLYILDRSLIRKAT
jgi:putative PIN family toxin of toxin-antitoxin system